jgi:hypothetical protein
MTGRQIYGFAAITAAIMLIVGIIVIGRLPTQEDCVASGGHVDPTQRHCEYGARFIQLREHVVGHATDPALAVPVVIALGGVIITLARRADRRRSRLSA